MGTDKSLLPVDGVAMAARVAATAAAAGCHPVFAVGGDAPALEQIGLDSVPDEWPGEGPLGGVLTALRHGGDVEALVVLACDLPYLTPHTVSMLLDSLEREPAALAAVATTDRRQPLCVAWRPDAWASLHTAFTGGERRLQAVLARMAIVEVSVNLQDLTNMNAPGDLPTSL